MHQQSPQQVVVQVSDAIHPTRRFPDWVRRFFRFLLVYVMVPIMSIIGIFGFAQRWMIYQPTRTSPLPADRYSGNGIVLDDVVVPTADNLRLHGWLFHSTTPPNDERKRIVIYFGGNGGCRAHRIEDCQDLTRLGCDVLLCDYRGYAENAGSPSEANFAADAQSIWSFTHDTLGYQPHQVVIFGESLGGAVATRLAAEASQAGTPPAALILNSTFSSLVDTAGWHYPLLPVGWMLLDRFPSVDRIPFVTCPILQFHGTADLVVPLQHGQRLFDAAPQKSASGIAKQIVVIPSADHNMIRAGEMHSSIQALLTQLP